MKKTLALSLVVLMLFSSITAFAAETVLNLGDDITLTGEETSISIPITLKSVGFDLVEPVYDEDEESDTYEEIINEPVGVTTIGAALVYDSAVLTLNALANGEVKAGDKSLANTRKLFTLGTPSDIAGTTLKKVNIIKVDATGVDHANSFYKTGVVVKVKFDVNSDADVTSTEVKLTELEVAASNAPRDIINPADSAVTINFPAPVVPSKPETTVVKTFPKRFYAGNALTTVGVILEGQDFDNATAVKAGVNAERVDGKILDFASAPIASNTDEAKSYVMVTLGEITEEKTFKPTTPTRAYVDLDGVAIYGDFVTENATDATDVVTDADFED